MPPVLALAAAVIVAVVLVLRERTRTRDVSAAIWLPCLWLFFLGSRAPSEWLGTGSVASPEAVMDGSPTDRAVYAVLIVCALLVLLQRRVAWMSFFRRNAWFTAFLAYAALSIYWSDFPDIALKRWLKGLGDPLMAMIVLSELHPASAALTVLRRLAFVLVPLSIVFIKYFPQLGRTYEAWSGAAAYTGVTMNKNMMGYLLLVFGLLFACTVFTSRPDSTSEQRRDRVIAAVFLSMVAWLFWIVDSKTPLVALFAAILAVSASSVPVIRRSFGVVLLGGVAVAIALQLAFDVSQQALAQVGRDATLTGRTQIWASVLALSANPFIGTGFESFWLGPRLKAMWQQFPVFRPIQAHDGYLEIYLNLGLIGLSLVLGFLTSSYRSIKRQLDGEESHESVPRDVNETIVTRFALGYLIAFVLYNVTEASFQPLNFLFVVLLLATLGSEGLRHQMEETFVSAEALSRTMPSTPDATVTASPSWSHPNVNRDWTPRRPQQASGHVSSQ